jgi:secondary thiamine-phosphate synthase enzyme
MSIEPLPSPRSSPGAYGETVHLRTQRSQQFADITELVAERVRRSGISRGVVNVQSCHTTASILVNEFEPELLLDLDRLTEEWAPRDHGYRHDRRDMPPGERANGHAHARAVLLGTSVILNVDNGEIRLGRWQRILLAELDGPRRRGISIVVLGVPSRRPGGAARFPRVASIDGRGA